MPIYALPEEHVFPDPEMAHRSGLLAVGGDLDPDRLIAGYSSGIFPWYSEGQPILWYSPDPRFVLPLSELRVGRTLRQSIRHRRFDLTMDAAFRDVIEHCASIPRPGQKGTWITAAMVDGYVTLHERGFAHSVEAWLHGDLVGGLYGVSLGSLFFGESMFSLLPEASKVAFVAFAGQIRAWGIDLLDSQVPTRHLARFGARSIPRRQYLEKLRLGLRVPTRQGAWSFEGGPYDLAGTDRPR